MSERHRFDEVSLQRWLEGNLGDFEGPVTVTQFAGGQSNPTFHLASASGDYVLRKKPPGELLPSAHAIDREYRVILALADSRVPVPTARGFCEDETVIGTPFYVMDYLPGRIFTDPVLPDFAPADRKAVYESMSQTLAAIHTFDWERGGLDGFGRPGDYFARQVSRWTSQVEESGLDEALEMSELRRWVEANVPDDNTSSIVHGDYRIGNLIIDSDEPTVIGVLDWELSTIGHPLADLAFNCMTYHLPAGHPVAPGFVGADRAALGIPGEAEYLESYARHGGADPHPLWKFCMAFSLYRTAAIQLGIYARAVGGNAISDMARLFGDSYRMVAEAGLRVAREG